MSLILVCRSLFRLVPMAKWFTLLDEKIEGPFTTDQLLQKAESGALPENLLVWGTLQTTWKPWTWWQKSLPHFKSIETDMNQPETWFMAQNGRKTGPFLRQQVVDRLKSMMNANEPLNKTLLWTKGLKKWADVTEFHDLMNEIGLDKRVHPRANLAGQITVHFQGQTFISTVKSISEGGLGIDPIPMVSPGEEITLEVESAHLNYVVKAKAEVRYSTERCMGLKFVTLNSESRSEIVTYVKKSLKQDIKAA